MKKQKYLLALLSFILLLSHTLTTFSQQQKPVQKCMYLNAKTQKIYIQEELPAYFFMSTSPDGKDMIRLTSENKKTNPMYFDGDGTHFMQHNDLHEPEPIKFEIYADAAAPKSSITYGQVPLHSKRDTLFIGKGLTVNLTSVDELSGVKEIYYSIDGAEYQLYSQPIKCEAQKQYTFRYYAVDNVGNMEAANTKSVMADFTPPVTQYAVNGDQSTNILSVRTTLSLSSKDDQSGVNQIYYKIDDGKFIPYTNAISLGGLQEGNHKLTFYTVDNVKNEESTKSYEFYLDRTAPIVVDEVLGNTFVSNGKAYSSGRTRFKLTAVDNKSGVKEIYYSLNGAEYALYDKPFYLPTKSGGMLIRYYAVDNVNNKGLSSSESNRTSATYVDLTGPNLSYAYKGPFFQTRDTSFLNSKTDVILQANDPESGVNKIGYVLDNATESQYNGPFKIEKEGIHKIEYIGYDNVENTNRSTFLFIIDNTPPAINLEYSIAPIGKKNVYDKTYNIYPSYVQIYLSGTDKKVGVDKIFYTLNKSPEKLYTGIISGLSKRTNYELKIRCLDKLGNESTGVFVFATEE